jgi:hypothetical protein
MGKLPHPQFPLPKSKKPSSASQQDFYKNYFLLIPSTGICGLSSISYFLHKLTSFGFGPLRRLVLIAG